MNLLERLIVALQEIGADIKALRARRVITTPAPPIGWHAPSFGTLVGSGTGGVSANRQYFTPYIVGDTLWTTDAAVLGITTAGAAGGTVYVTLYADDNGFPDTGRLLAQGTLNPATTGNSLVVAFDTAVPLVGGLYWVSLLLIGGSGSVFRVHGNTSWGLAIPSGSAVNNTNRGYWIAGRSAPLTTRVDPATFNFTANTDSPIINLRRSA